MRNNRLSVIFARFACLVLVIFMAFASALPSAAAGLDPNHKGSITFVMTSSSDLAYIGGGSIALYKVASLVGGTGDLFYLTDEFSAFDGNINGIGIEGESDAALAEQCAMFIKNHSIDINAGVYEINSFGYAKADILDTGLYLAVQKDIPYGYRGFLPFFIVLPYYDGTNYNYEVVAKPKGIEKLPVKDCVVSIPDLKKEILGDGAPVDSEFEYRFEALQSGYPEIVNSSGSVDIGGDVVSQSADEIVLRTVGEETVEIGKITFNKPGDYYYRLSEINTGAEHFKYDKTVYWTKFEIRLNSSRDALVISRAVIKLGDANGKVVYEGSGDLTYVFKYTNTYENTTPPPDTETTPPDTEPTPPDTETTPPDTETTPPDTETNPPDTQTPPETTPVTPSRGNGGTPSILPQTGQVWWPVVVFGLLGVIFIVAGISVSKCGRKDD